MAVVLLAHVSHWLWLLYLPPVLIVLFSIVRMTIVERRRKRANSPASTRGRAPGP